MYLPSINAGDFYGEGPDRLHRMAGAAVGVDADAIQKAFGSYADVIGAENELNIAIALNKFRNPQPQQKSGALQAFEFGTSLLGGAITSGMGSGGDVGISGIGLGEDQASLVPGIDVRPDIDNRLNPIAGFGGVMNA